MIHPTHSLIVLLDGAADEKLDALGGLTPLEFAEKPFIDAIAASGVSGCSDGKAYTHLFMLELLGGRSLDVPRGVIEAIGHGVPVSDDEIAYRLTPATIADGRIHWEYQVADEEQRMRHLANRHLQILSKRRPGLHFYGQGKGILTLHSETVQTLPMPPEDADWSDFGELGPYVEAVTEENHGLGYVPWGGGRMRLADERRPARATDGLAVFSKSPSVLGVAAYFGIENHEVSEYVEGLNRALPELRRGNVLWHVEETDDAGHRRDPLRKVEVIEDVDRLLRRNRDRLEGRGIAFIIDHGTSSVTGRHIVTKVPYATGPVVDTMKGEGRFQENEDRHIALQNLLETLVR